jgi:enterochelin esterase-like enzyme
MKKLTIITAVILTANLLFGQINKIDTSFYSEALGEEKMVDVYFPPDYDENPDLYYPVIYYLHGWTGDQNSMGTMLSWLQSLINNGTIDPVIMVGGGQ